MSKRLDRRNFLAQAGTAAATSTLFTANSYARIAGANNRIQMAIIGAGGRGNSVMRSFLSFKDDVEFIAVSDVYEPRQNSTLKACREGSKATVDYRPILDNKEVVAVLNATPDHWHGPVLMDAVKAGKDVYTEKPFSLTIEQGAQMVKAVRATKQIVQVGMQRRSSDAVRGAKKLIDEGMLGDIVIARAQWYWSRKPMSLNPKLEGALDWERFQQNARKKHPLDAKRFLNWRNFIDYNGGHMTDQGTHLMDVIQWFCNNGKPPVSAVCQGAVMKHKGGDAPDTFSAVYEYPSFMATWTLCYSNSYHNGWQIILQGSKATMELDDDGYRVYPEPWESTNKIPTPLHEFKGGIPTEPHVRNFLDCVRSRQEPNAPVEVGHNAVSAPHLANLSMWQKRRVTLSDDGTTTAKL
ncbi:MAG: Gfo/Idh/MocA family oxidoreductase [Acidobacteria bacterium]|nr:Gfo/Idh/MocA family oxidoreductase [Acidobacteriota bacterium]